MQNSYGTSDTGTRADGPDFGTAKDGSLSFTSQVGIGKLQRLLSSWFHLHWWFKFALCASVWGGLLVCSSAPSLSGRLPGVPKRSASSYYLKGPSAAVVHGQTPNCKVLIWHALQGPRTVCAYLYNIIYYTHIYIYVCIYT